MVRLLAGQEVQEATEELGNLLHLLKAVNFIDLAPCGSQFVLAHLLDLDGVFAGELGEQALV